ncbi:MAG: 3-hydroxyacyl-CoA dehydrogenase family protein [Methanobacteriota archaeon]|nr:MAG: 3-hydroxyacyl-CoA dehydrogenase family protein [Euryarchaeota archaeon]
MDIQNIVVIGTGAMGSGIAYVSAVAGYNVTVLDREQKFLDAGMEKIKQALMQGIDRGKMSPAEGQKVFQRIKATLDMKEALEGAHLVIEAVFEDMDVKKEVFSNLSDLADEKTILASNTSTLSITEISTVVKKPERVIGLHFFNPPAAMKLVEVVLGKETSEDVKEKAIAFVQKLGKQPIVTKDSPGFIVNRVLLPALNEAAKLLDEGVAAAEDIDKALVLGANFPVGPLTLADMVGLDVALASQRTMERAFGECYKPAEILVKLVEEGNLGIKTGKGFFEYK